MNDRKLLWAPPEMEIVTFQAEDVIRTSGTARKDNGFGDKYNWDELFGEDS